MLALFGLCVSASAGPPELSDVLSDAGWQPIGQAGNEQTPLDNIIRTGIGADGDLLASDDLDLEGLAFQIRAAEILTVEHTQFGHDDSPLSVDFDLADELAGDNC